MIRFFVLIWIAERLFLNKRIKIFPYEIPDSGLFLLIWSLAGPGLGPGPGPGPGFGPGSGPGPGPGPGPGSGSRNPKPETLIRN